jgi:branched-chain amino acid transport system substrate-binding protein
MSKTNKIILWIIAIIILLALIWLGYSEKQPVVEGEVIKIGYIGPLTGDSSVLGIDASNSIELAVEEANKKGGINGKMIELIVEDDQYKTTDSISAYRKLVDIDNVENILISTYGGLFAIAEQSKNDNVLVIDVLDCDKDIANLPDNIFCIAKESEDFGNIMAEFTVKQGYKKIGILVGLYDKFLSSVAEVFEKKIEDKAEIQIEEYIRGTSDFKTSLLKLKDNDVIMILGNNDIGIAFKQAKELNINKQFLSVVVITSPSVQEASGGAVEGVYFPDYIQPENNEVAEKFYSDFKSKFERDPYIFLISDQAYDSAKILIDEVLSKVKGETREERIEEKIELLHNVKDYKGVSGNLTMKEDGRIGGISFDVFQLRDMIPVLVTE